jgi:predicted secreted hydrolase
VTGNLDGERGERFGYELTIFRFALSPDAPPASESAWRTNQVYIGHFAVTDVPGDEFHVAQRYSRAHPDLAGARAEPFRVWIDDWEIAALDSGQSWRLDAGEGDISLGLTITPRKPPVLNGADGLSRKSAEVGNASYYYSIPRLRSEGTLTIGDRAYAVSGMSWLDREWGSSALAANQQGWDWFALQLSDGTDLMYYQVRRTDGSIDDHSAGTRVARDGSYEHLGVDDVSLKVTGTWESELGGTYPAGWTLRIRGSDTLLTVVPVLENQELITNVRYWEGAVDVNGTSGGRTVTGRGYVELTGYADRPSIP